MNTDDTLPESATGPTNAQSFYVRFVMAVLIDLVVLNLFDEYSAKVAISSFTVSLFAALLLQILLKLTLHIEHRVAAWFKTKPGLIWTLGRFLAAWLILFGSKFVILWAINISFGDNVKFYGALHGIVALITVLVVIIAAEELVARIHRQLAKLG